MLAEEDVVISVAVASQITPEEAVEYLRALPMTLAAMGPREQGDLLRATYQKIEVRGPEFVGVYPTPDALAHGLDLALPEQVQVASGVRVGGEGRQPPVGSCHRGATARRSQSHGRADTRLLNGPTVPLCQQNRSLTVLQNSHLGVPDSHSAALAPRFAGVCLPLDGSEGHHG